MVEALARRSARPVDAHLMITDADRHAPAYVEAGAGSVTFHVEAAAAPVRLAREIRAQGARASMALKPATPIEPYEDLLAELDMVLIMTVEPGFGGQSFLDLCLPKIRTARSLMNKHGLETWLQVDGGISLETIERCAEAGADVFVAGSAVFSADDPDAMVAALREKAEARERPSERCGQHLGDRSAALCHTGGVRATSSRALGSVKLRTGGESPRPGCSQQPVDQVELLDRRSKSGWEDARGTVPLAPP